MTKLLGILLSGGDISRFSKVKVFVEVQLVLQIHGRTLSEISEGGRQGIFLKAITTYLKVFPAAM